MPNKKQKEGKESPKAKSPATEEPSPSKESVPAKVQEEVKDTPPKTPERAEAEKEEDEEEEEITLGAAVAGFSTWFTSTFSNAKEKSTEMFQYLKQDLSEFSDTVTEASKDFKEKLKLEENAKSAVQTMTSKASIVLDQMSTIFGVGPDDDDEEIVMNSSESVVVDRVKNKMYSMSILEDIFLKDPADIKAYENWILAFDLEKKNEEMSDLMTANPHLQLRYAQLVPQKVSHLVFWHRFYYHIHELCIALAEEEKELAREKSLLAKKATTEGKESDNSDLCMNRNEDSPSSDPSLVDISEEDQKRLLAEYEEEMKNSSAQHSRRSSGTQMSSSSSGSFAIVTHDAATDEVKVE